MGYFYENCYLFNVIFNTYKNTCNIYVSYKANKVPIIPPSNLGIHKVSYHSTCVLLLCPTPEPCPFPVEMHLEFCIYHSFPFWIVLLYRSLSIKNTVYLLDFNLYKNNMLYKYPLKPDINAVCLWNYSCYEITVFTQLYDNPLCEHLFTHSMWMNLGLFSVLHYYVLLLWAPLDLFLSLHGQDCSIESILKVE